MISPSQYDGGTASVTSRLASFRPLIFTEMPEIIFFSHLSDAGFFYPGNHRWVQCYGCGRRVELIAFNSDPRGQGYHNPDCQYVNQVPPGHSDPSQEASMSEYNDELATPELADQSRDEPTQDISKTNASRGNDEAHTRHIGETDQSSLISNAVSSTSGSKNSNQLERVNIDVHTNGPTYPLSLSQNSTNRDQLTSSALEASASSSYPAYSDLTKRLPSFTNWPVDHVHTPENLATAGFFYAGYSDCVRCFHCGIGLRNWRPGDDIYEQHYRFRPECRYLKARLAELRQSRPTSAKLEYADQNRVEVTQDIATTNAIRRNDEAHERHIGKSHQSSLSNIMSSTSEAKNSNQPDSQPTTHNITKTLLQRENDSLKERTICKLCYVAQVQEIFLPCGDMVTCKHCSNRIIHCPCCDRRILGTVTVYFT